MPPKLVVGALAASGALLYLIYRRTRRKPKLILHFDVNETIMVGDPAGGDTFGVIPVHLLQAEVGKRDLTSFIVTENMHERKKVMYMNSDAIVVLPGGAGTLDEFFEILTWAQLGLHTKPILLLNTEGFWTPLIGLIDHVIDQGFADAGLKDMILVADTPAAAMDILKTCLA